MIPRLPDHGRSGSSSIPGQLELVCFAEGTYQTVGAVNRPLVIISGDAGHS